VSVVSGLNLASSQSAEMRALGGSLVHQELTQCV
jgi:hypothetical protein